MVLPFASVPFSLWLLQHSLFLRLSFSEGPSPLATYPTHSPPELLWPLWIQPLCIRYVGKYGGVIVLLLVMTSGLWKVNMTHLKMCWQRWSFMASSLCFLGISKASQIILHQLTDGRREGLSSADSYLLANQICSLLPHHPLSRSLHPRW
jgi:hypothetical protein